MFINGHVPPLPSAARVYRFGRSVRAAIDCFPGEARVAVIGSGSFSLEVFGPRIIPGSSFGVPDPAWAARVQTHMQDGTVAALLGEATEERMLAAGNIAGELLDWIAMLGTIGRIPWRDLDQGAAEAGPFLRGLAGGCAMSLYALNYLCRETLRDHGFREAMRTDPRSAVSRFALTEEEREALLAGEVGQLYAMGVNAFLMGYLVRHGLLGLTLESYQQKLAAASLALGENGGARAESGDHSAAKLAGAEAGPA